SGCSRSRGAFNVLTDPLALFPLFFFGISSCFLIVFLLDRLLELGKIYLFPGEIRPAKFLIFGGNGRILLLSCLRGGFRWFCFYGFRCFCRLFCSFWSLNWNYGSFRGRGFFFLNRLGFLYFRLWSFFFLRFYLWLFRCFFSCNFR